MLLPHEGEKLKESRSKVRETRIPTAIAGYIVVITAYSCISTSNFGLRILLCVALFVAIFYFFMTSLEFFAAHVTIAKLVIKTKVNEKNFFKDVDKYRRAEIHSRN